MRLDARDPLAHRFVDRVLQRRAPRLDRHDLGAEQLHAPHVERLALDVDRTHVDGAVETEQRGGGRGRDTVLAGARLRDHALLAHAPRQQRLAEHVVDLVRAGVREVFALQQHAHAEPLREPVTLGDRRRPADVARQQIARTRRGTRRRARPRRNSASSCSSAGTSVSGAKRPPNSPKRPRPTGSGPGGSRCTGTPRAGTDIQGSSDEEGRLDHTGQRLRNRPEISDSDRGYCVELPVPRAGHAGDVDVEVAPLFGRRSAYSSTRFGARRARELDEAPQLARILLPGSRLDAGRDVDAPRPHEPDRVADVLGREAAREQDAHAARRALGEPPVEDLARTRDRASRRG